MPTYEYACDNCEYQFETFQSMKDRALKRCPKCGKSALKRMIGTGAAVLFKGSGFYTTDYRSENYQKAAKAEKGQQGGSSEKSKDKSLASPAKDTVSTKAEAQ